MTTTAEYRKQAQEFEAQLKWYDAAEAWDKAIEAYPTTGALADLDKAKMLKRRNGCMDQHNYEANRRAADALDYQSR